MNQGIPLSIVIPAYNEAQRIAPSLTELAAFLHRSYPQSEVLVVDDGSTDDTVAVVRAELARLNRPSFRLVALDQNYGKGYAVKTGVLHAAGARILFMDADLSTPLSEIEKVLAPLERGFEVAIGSRGLPASDIRIHQPFYREMMGKVFNRMVRLLVIDGIFDTQCGFKAFRADAAKRIFPLLQTNRFGFDVEVLLLAKQLGYRIEEVPVVWLNAEGSRVAALSDSLEMFLSLLRLKRQVKQAIARHNLQIATDGKSSL